MMWIDTDDVKPELEEEVLVYCDNDDGSEGWIMVARYWEAENGRSGWDSHTDYYESLPVTHWMPLPLGPYEREETQ
jgi:hypothetical protein